jgi:hypothetical protein
MHDLYSYYWRYFRTHRGTSCPPPLASPRRRARGATLHSAAPALAVGGATAKPVVQGATASEKNGRKALPLLAPCEAEAAYLVCHRSPIKCIRGERASIFSSPLSPQRGNLPALPSLLEKKIVCTIVIVEAFLLLPTAV